MTRVAYEDYGTVVAYHDRRSLRLIGAGGFPTWVCADFYFLFLDLFGPFLVRVAPFAMKLKASILT